MPVVARRAAKRTLVGVDQRPDEPAQRALRTSLFSVDDQDDVRTDVPEVADEGCDEKIPSQVVRYVHERAKLVNRSSAHGSRQREHAAPADEPDRYLTTGEDLPSILRDSDGLVVRIAQVDPDGAVGLGDADEHGVLGTPEHRLGDDDVERVTERL